MSSVAGGYLAMMVLLFVMGGISNSTQSGNTDEIVYEKATVQRIRHFAPTYSVLLRDSVTLKNPGTVTKREKTRQGKQRVVQLRNTIPVNIDVYADGVYMGFVGKQAVVTLLMWENADIECRTVYRGLNLGWGPRKCTSACKVTWYLQDAEK